MRREGVTQSIILDDVQMTNVTDCHGEIAVWHRVWTTERYLWARKHFAAPTFQLTRQINTLSQKTTLTLHTITMTYIIH